MFCSRCGALMPEGTVFCSNCGASMGDTSKASGSANAAPSHENWDKTYTENGAVYSYAGNTPGTKTIDKKKLILIAVAAILAISAIAVGIFLIASANNPVTKLAGAAGKSFASLTDAVGKEFSAALTNAEKLLSKDEFTASFNYSCKSSYSDEEYSIVLNKDKKELSADALYDLDGEKLDLSLYANADALYASSSIADDAYYVDLKDFGDGFKRSDLYELIEDELDSSTLEALEAFKVDLFADTGWDAFKKAYTDEVKEFMDSVVIEETDEEIPDTDRDMTVYTVEFDDDAYVDMMMAYEEFSVESVLGEGVYDNLTESDYYDDDSYDFFDRYSYDIYVGVADGELVAAHMNVRDGSFESTLTLALEGKDNPWEEFYVYIDEDEFIEGTLETEGNGFVLELDIDGDEFVIEGDSSEIVIKYEDEVLYVIEYSSDNDGIYLSCDYEEEYYDYYGDRYSYKYSISLEIVPLEKIEKIEDAENFFKLSEDELEELGEEIENSIY